ncbi:bifunctional PIG-L family deacetylase/class I SAM-dependent methyltransferase [Gulosibacter massiliensis]|uniref:bifunctional PIG-L family deacetylase/class I SAM-dependent methyltransferase n=1 Tax=Gulosibacter massiliensis TaxID=2479839 RepID=UPI000F63532E|nr:bifunctional PIG-L family deacetylase/class I SAM-dependent methyltransferase [Gulosibacter massiliensis]
MTAPRFTHDEPGTGASDWDCAHELPGVTTTQLLSPGAPLVVVVAHPDDETLGAGGLIATAAAHGHDVTVVLCSDGEASHPDSRTHTRQELAVIRRREFTAAMDALGSTSRKSCNHVSFTALGLPDGHVGEFGTEIEGELRRLVTPGSTIASPWRSDGHPDHDAVGEIAAAVAAELELTLLEFPIWYWHWAQPVADPRWRSMRTFRLDPSAAGAKRLAMAAYPSQTTPLSAAAEDAPVLTEQFLQHFHRDTEVFLRTEPGSLGAPQARETFNSLFNSDPDPWRFDSDYEVRKREVLLTSLSRPVYRQALELGSATGALTERLAQRCESVVAIDASDVAVERSRVRLSKYRHVRVEQREVPADWPDTGPFDLVIMSEFGYYLTRIELGEVFERIEASVTPDAQVVLCHWLHPIDGWALDGRDVHEAARRRGWTARVTHHEADFLLEVFTLNASSDSI